MPIKRTQNERFDRSGKACELGQIEGDGARQRVLAKKVTGDAQRGVIRIGVSHGQHVGGNEDGAFLVGRSDVGQPPAGHIRLGRRRNAFVWHARRPVGQCFLDQPSDPVGVKVTDDRQLALLAAELPGRARPSWPRGALVLALVAAAAAGGLLVLGLK